MSEQRVYIVQCLCPERHCIMASAVVAESPEGCREGEAKLLEAIDMFITHKVIDPWCGLCRAPREQWHTATGRTEWATMAEAEPFLRANEEAQRQSAEQIKASRN